MTYIIISQYIRYVNTDFRIFYKFFRIFLVLYCTLVCFILYIPFSCLSIP
nr:MAG TPA: hypothetical protein [Caudoviricetes sp.]